MIEPVASGTTNWPRPAALLFDLDGVIADVSRSYRQAIIATAATWGVRLEPETVSSAKASGNANNDWELTRRLIGARGPDVPLAQVKDRFEALYQGSDDQPGLWQQETLLVARDWLEKLATRLPLGIVTGRPRSDADRFLGTTGIAACFTAMVCMEDAPAKPNPAPVRLLLEQLGATRAWMIGDTPDDMRAAVAASVLALGIAAPGDDRAEAALALREAGATRVLASLVELDGLLAAVR